MIVWMRRMSIVGRDVVNDDPPCQATVVPCGYRILGLLMPEVQIQG